ncbi:hypothetical protein GALL_403410 [mine drainage metagenome]|uniref:Uncharacterized protein n=1 Tax=mine drainage metagenome TaxID=410659 RepID=A0A1J5Q3R6_9ZZZZ
MNLAKTLISRSKAVKPNWIAKLLTGLEIHWYT